MQDELKIQEMKLEMKSRMHEKRENQERVNVKLPKLIITKFDDTILNWFRFWKQFDNEIAKAKICPVSKFSYLNELSIPRVTLLIEDLSFTSEGYSRVKSIILDTFNKSTEIAA